MADLTFRRPHTRDIVELAAHLRVADRVELAACDHFDVLKVVEESVQRSPLCWSALHDGKVLCIFGVAPLRDHLLLEHVGVPWLLATDEMAAHRRKLTVLPPSYIAKMLDAYPRLVNFVHVDNVQAIRWLKRLGFNVAPAAPFGPNGAPFHRFEMQHV